MDSFKNGDVAHRLDQLVSEVRELHSLVRSKSDRCVIFIDNTNLSQTIKKVDNTGLYRIDYLKLTRFLARDRFLKQTRIYYSDFADGVSLSTEDKTKRQQREDFYNFLRWQGFYLKACSLVEREGVRTEKGLDGSIIRDMERLCHDNRIDTAILVAGDLDYKDVVVDVQKDYCTTVEVAFFSSFTARDLMSKATRFVDLWAAKELLSRSDIRQKTGD